MLPFFPWIVGRPLRPSLCMIGGSLSISLTFVDRASHFPPSATMTASQSIWRISSGKRGPSPLGPPSSDDFWFNEMEEGVCRTPPSLA